MGDQFTTHERHCHDSDLGDREARIGHRCATAVADSLGLDLASTWSCGYGGPTQCGECHPCTLRQEAFARAGIEDRTTYRVARTGAVPVFAR